MTPMIVQCSSCLTEFELDPEKVPASGVRARCSVCSAVIVVPAPRSAPVTAEPQRAAPVAAPAPPAPPPSAPPQWSAVPVEAPAAARTAPEPSPAAPEPAAAATASVDHHDVGLSPFAPPRVETYQSPPVASAPFVSPPEPAARPAWAPAAPSAPAPTVSPRSAPAAAAVSAST